MTQTQSEAPPTTNAVVRERRTAWLIAAFAMLFTMLPYLIGYSFAEDRRFMWLGYNLDDSSVYLSWMRQAAAGHLRAYNLFTTDLQHGMALNPLFLSLGRIAGATGLPLLAVYHAARMVFGFALLAAVWEFLRLTVADNKARWLALLFVCFSSGLGWLPIWWDVSPYETPIDKWQPEAITFLSLYLSPLFCFSMLLQVSIISLLFRGAQTGRARYAIVAGVCGFLLGLVHTYDVLSLAAVWLVYLLLQTVLNTKSREAKPNARRTPWLHALLAGAITLPGVAYIYLQLKSETVFRERANVLTLSPSFAWVILGYGLTLLLAILGIMALQKASEFRRNAPESGTSTRWTIGSDAAWLLAVWADINIAVSYLPGHMFPFQRKMLQGAHFPIAILAGIGAAWLLRSKLPSLSGSRFALAAFVTTLLLSLTNVRFILRDLANDTINISQTKLQRVYVQPGELEALNWIAKNTPENAAVQPLFWIRRTSDGKIGVVDTAMASFTPGLTGRHVYCGHWGETPEFGEKLGELMRFGLPRTTDEERIALLRKMKVGYLLFTQKNPADTSADELLPMFRGQASLPSYLTRVYSNADADIYKVNL